MVAHICTEWGEFTLLGLSRMKIVDDDVDWKQLAGEEKGNEEEEEEEAPVVNNAT